MAGSEFISDLRDADRAHLDLGEAVAVLILGNHHLLNPATLAMPQRRRLILINLSAIDPRGLLLRQLDHFPDDDIISGDPRPGLNQTIGVELPVHPVPKADCGLGRRDAEGGALVVGLGLGVVVAPEEDRSEEASIDGGLVEDDRILLVVAGEATDGRNDVEPRGQLLKVQVLHGASDHQRLLWVVEQVR